jgi:hypothetical protein
MQKTWQQLLGRVVVTTDLVDGNSIVRRTGCNQYKTLRTFQDHQEALEAFRAWLFETLGVEACCYCGW